MLESLPQPDDPQISEASSDTRPGPTATAAFATVERSGGDDFAERSAPEPPTVSSRVEVTALSDMGCVRTNNEDAFGYDHAHGIYVLCDGMGGSTSGEVASSLAVATAIESFVMDEATEFNVGTRLLRAVTQANQAVWQKGQLPEHSGMGSTMVLAALEPGGSPEALPRLIIGNVGDSRAYLIEGTRCLQLTVDHSYVNELIGNGTITPENAHTVDLKGMESVITRAIGAAEDVQPDFSAIELHAGSTVLLASDGLTRHVSNSEIISLVQNHSLPEACAALVGLARDRGGQDNITCLLLRVKP